MLIPAPQTVLMDHKLFWTLVWTSEDIRGHVMGISLFFLTLI